MVGYIRVSSVDQNIDRQHQHLVDAGVEKVFVDKASGRDAERPKLGEMLEFIREGDTIIVASMDRLARNVDDLRRIVAEQTKLGIGVRFLKEHLQFNGEDSPMANMLLSVLGAIAQFERELIRERQREGIEIAKLKGKYRGRKKALSDEEIVVASERIAAGETKSAVARAFGISRDTLYRSLARLPVDSSAF